MSISNWIYRYRGVLASMPLIFAFGCFKYEIEADWIIWPLGTSIFLLGFLLRVWAHNHCSYRQNVAKRLATTGPYLFVRNPLYIGNILLCLGATILSELLWLVPIVLFYCAGLYSLVVRHEEARLLTRYGEPYCKYMQEVPRWFPRVECLKNMEVLSAVRGETACLLILFPYIIKEVVEPWFEH